MNVCFICTLCVCYSSVVYWYLMKPFQECSSKRETKQNSYNMDCVAVLRKRNFSIQAFPLHSWLFFTHKDLRRLSSSSVSSLVANEAYTRQASSAITAVVEGVRGTGRCWVFGSEKVPPSPLFPTGELPSEKVGFASARRKIWIKPLNGTLVLFEL